MLETMLDSGAGLNTIPEEALVCIINGCEEAGIGMSDERHPVVELQSWDKPEECKMSRWRSVGPADRRRDIGPDLRRPQRWEISDGQREVQDPGRQQDGLGTDHPRRDGYRLRRTGRAWSTADEAQLLFGRTGDECRPE